MLGTCLHIPEDNYLHGDEADDYTYFMLKYFTNSQNVKKVYSLAFCSMLIIFVSPGKSSDEQNLIIGKNGSSEYQIIIPEKENATIHETAQLIRDAFRANNINLEVAKESNRSTAKPGIYLGNTEFARGKGIDSSQFKGWDYLFKVVGSDLIIAGSDNQSRAGIVKGSCDFLRRYVGTRFLSPGKTGIEFINTPVIAIPNDLNLVIKPTLKFNFSGGSPGIDFYNISNNAFPAGFKLDAHSWGHAIPFEKYHNHPEYSALIGGKRAFDVKGDVKGLPKSQILRVHQYCLSNVAAQELIYQDMLQSFDRGNEIVGLGQPDGNTHCECEECRKLYGTGDDWGDKIWIFNKLLCERLEKERPEAQVLILSYQMTKYPPKAFKAFPANAMILLTHIDSTTFAEWKKCKVPGGFAVYIYNWGVYHFVGYLPKKTPGYLENQVKSLYENKVTGIFKDGVGSCYGLEGPAYYVFGRMFDNPESGNSKDLATEYYTAAFGQAVEPMSAFFDIFYQGIEFYSEWLGPRSPAQRYIPIEGRIPLDVEDPLDWVCRSTSLFGAVGVRRFIETPERMLCLIYTPELLSKLEGNLAKAESIANSNRAKSRISLIRMEFDYIKNLITVLDLHNAYLIQPDGVSLERLLTAIDVWNKLLDSFYDSDGKMKPIDGWPEMKLFRGSSRQALGLVTLRNWENKALDGNPFAWKTSDLRKAGQK
jgi:hypothetical protein